MVSISDVALNQCKLLMENLKEDSSKHGGLRLKIEGGGCSGFQYNL